VSSCAGAKGNDKNGMSITMWGEKRMKSRSKPTSKTTGNSPSKSPIKRTRTGLSRAVLCLLFVVLVLLASCGNAPDSGNGNGNGNGSDDIPLDEVEGAFAHLVRPVAADKAVLPDIESDDTGVTLEYLGYTGRALELVITNLSGYDIRYDSGFEIVGTQWGSQGIWDDDWRDLPASGERVISVSIQGLGFGDFRITKNIIIDPDNPTGARPHEISARFVRENTDISPDAHGVTMEAVTGFATPVGAAIEITNAFGDGRLYFDKYYWIQRRAGGAWQDVPLVGSNNFPYDTHSLTPRQVIDLTVYWTWLYGELPPGDYRIGKSFLHRADDGEESRHDLYTTFTLDGNPVPDHVIRNGKDWLQPFAVISAIRTEVMECLAPDDFHVAPDNIGLLVSSLTPLWDTGQPSQQFYVWDNLPVIVLDADGEHMSFSDIRPGMTVDITFGGPVLLSNPAHISGALFIQIAESRQEVQ